MLNLKKLKNKLKDLLIIKLKNIIKYKVKL